MAAALAFYTILSTAPLVILTVLIVAQVVGHTTAEGQLLSRVGSLVGQEGVKTVQAMLDHAQSASSSAYASLVGVATLLFGASGVFVELRSALNKMWDVKPKGNSGIRGTIKERLFSFAMVLAIGFLLLISLLISTGLAVAGKFFGGFLPIPEWVLNLIYFAVSFAGTIVLFAIVFKYVPQTKISWKDVWEGSAVTALLFTIGKLLIGLYLGKASVGSAYGAAGSLIVVIVWVYYSAMIFYFGAEFTHVLAIHERRRQPAGATVRDG